MIPLLSALLLVSAPGVPRSECFPVERLPAADRARAEGMLLKMLDGEALYTLVGGLKPMSSGWLSIRFDVERPDLAEAEATRRAMRGLRCGDLVSTALQPFWRVYDGKRFLDGVVFHHGAVARTIERERAFFAFYGVTPSSPPEEAVMAFETDATPRRNLGYGVLFGYPRHAVDFFVSATESQRRTGKFVTRDFLSIPVFEGATNRFVYAVPKGQAPNEADLALRAAAAPILAKYRELRPRYIGPGKPGPARLLRDWMDDGKGRCSPETALAKCL